MIQHMVYILECRDGTLYTGYTNDFPKRLKAHETGKGAKYTRGRGPFKVLLQETFETKEKALRREAAIKKWSRAKKQKWVEERRENNGTEKFWFE